MLFVYLSVDDSNRIYWFQLKSYRSSGSKSVCVTWTARIKCAIEDYLGLPVDRSSFPGIIRFVRGVFCVCWNFDTKYRFVIECEGFWAGRCAMFEPLYIVGHAKLLLFYSMFRYKRTILHGQEIAYTWPALFQTREQKDHHRSSVLRIFKGPMILH